MGCDIHGAFEADGPHGWDYLGDLGWHVGRSYDTFGSLFGVRNNAGFEPAFPDRGLPDEMSWKLENRIDDYRDHYTGKNLIGSVDFHSPSYVWLEELLDLDWQEEAEGRDTRYTVLDENKEPTGTKFGWATGWEDVIEANQDRLRRGEAVPNEDGDKYVKQVKLTRREALSGSWEWVIFNLLPTFGEKYGNENIRMVVWFDN